MRVGISTNEQRKIDDKPGMTRRSAWKDPLSIRTAKKGFGKTAIAYTMSKSAEEMLFDLKTSTYKTALPKKVQSQRQIEVYITLSDDSQAHASLAGKNCDVEGPPRN